MKKLVVCLLTVATIVCGCMALTSCNNPQQSQPENDAQIVAIYDMYVTNAVKKGETPLSYEEWLASIKGEKGDDGLSAYEIWLAQGYEGTEQDFLEWLKTGETHDYGEWTVFGDNQSCEKLVFYRVCSICDKIELKSGFSEHVVGETYFYDESFHWGCCIFCTEVFSKSEHSFNEEGDCLICGYCSTDTLGVIYEVDESGEYARVRGYEGTDEEVKIAKTYNGVPVVEIYERAFADKSITSVIIPDSIEYVGVMAFEDCDSLTSVVIGDSVTSIGEFAFDDCDSLISVVIGAGVADIGERAFSFCSSLTSITIDVENKSYTSIDGNLYSKDGKTLIQYAIGKTDKEFIVPEGVEYVGKNAFSECASLTSVVIGDSVTSIDNNAFSFSRLTSVVIGDSVTSIGSYAFYYCSSLTSVVIGDSVTSIGNGAFAMCDSVTNIVIPDSVDCISMFAFNYCTSLTTVVIQGSAMIEYDAFYGCSSLTNLVISNGVVYIGDYAFEDTNLTKVYYEGTAEDWANFSKNFYDDNVKDATRYYYSEVEPTDAGNYWHYDEDGNVVEW